MGKPVSRRTPRVFSKYHGLRKVSDKKNSPEALTSAPTLKFKIFVTLWTIVENILFSGLRAGWPALVYILKEERIYHNLCVNETIILPTIDESGGTARQPDTSNGLTTGSSLDVNNSSGSWNTGQGQHDGLNVTLQCDDQDLVFNQCFTIASALMALSSLLYGHLNFRFGIRVPRILSVFLFTTGCLCLAFINVDMPWLVYPGFMLISAGGNALYITNSQVSYYFTTAAVAVIGLECGALEASSFMQSAIKIAYENGVSLRTSYITLAVSYLVTLFSTFVLFPKGYIADESKRKRTPADCEMMVSDGITVSDGKENYSKSSSNSQIYKIAKNDADAVTDDPRSNGLAMARYDELVAPEQIGHNDVTMETSNKCENEMRELKEKSPNKNEENKNNDPTSTEMNNLEFKNLEQSVSPSVLPEGIISEKNASLNSLDAKCSAQTSIVDNSNSKIETPTLLRCLMSRTFILYLFWASVVQLVLSMALGTFNPWLEFVLEGDLDQVSVVTDILLYSMLGSPVLSLSLGIAMDALQYWRKDRKALASRTMFSSAVCLGATSLLCVLVCVMFMIKDAESLVFTSISLVLFRTSLYSCGTGFLRIMYPTQYFGILCGVMAVLAGGFSFLQYPLFIIVTKSNGAWTEIFGGLALLGLVSLAQPFYLLWTSSREKKSSAAHR